MVVPPGTSSLACRRESAASQLTGATGHRGEKHPAPHGLGSDAEAAATPGLEVCYRPFLPPGRPVAKGRTIPSALKASLLAYTPVTPGVPEQYGNALGPSAHGLSSDMRLV